MVTHRLIAAEIEYMMSLLRPVQAMFGAAAGITTESFGTASAMSMQANPDPAFNRVLGFGDSSLPLLDEILDWYAQRQTLCRFDVLAGTSDPSLSARLAERSFSAHPLETFLCAPPGIHALPLAAGPEVRELGRDELEEFIHAFLAVYPQPPEAEEATRVSVRAQYGQPEWHCYVAHMEGAVAAFGAMYVNNGTAALISAATLPQFRRQGCQTALLARRMADAVELGCDLIWSHAACGSTSQSNMERRGMRPAAVKYRYERSFISRLPPPAAGSTAP